MKPDAYEIPEAIQADMLVIAAAITKQTNIKPLLFSVQQRGALKRITAKLQDLGNFPFRDGNIPNAMFLMKPAITFGYVRIACDYVDRVLTGVPNNDARKAATRVRGWLDAIGHVYPVRHLYVALPT